MTSAGGTTIRSGSKGQDGNVLHALGDLARGTPDATLFVVECFALLLALAILAWLPARLVFALPLVALSMFGLWGIAEHFSRSERIRVSRTGRSLVGGFQWLVAATAVISAGSFVLYLFGAAIGTIIS